MKKLFSIIGIVATLALTLSVSPQTDNQVKSIVQMMADGNHGG
ncbi:hypothetical protein ACRS52_13710 [Bacillus cytotoxicus]|uniref:Phr family secreted Rap phosphatase inhibitor n=1 Tax=Bacillus cytotoxicus TaxID=580165 RepID=A0AAX2CEI1_9BACI|nr:MULTISPECIES: hypothetical protein [Bacillus cereus group]SCL87122.1 Uncharacterized protein BCB44BAC_01088 [Bacillus cytotoxicus]